MTAAGNIEVAVTHDHHPIVLAQPVRSAYREQAHRIARHNWSAGQVS